MNYFGRTRFIIFCDDINIDLNQIVFPIIVTKSSQYFCRMLKGRWEFYGVKIMGSG